VRARERERKRERGEEGEKWENRRGYWRDLDTMPIVLPSSLSLHPALQNPPPLSTDRSREKEDTSDGHGFPLLKTDFGSSRNTAPLSRLSDVLQTATRAKRERGNARTGGNNEDGVRGDEC